MSYSDLLKDPRWQRKRLEVMQRDDFRCIACGDDKTTLNVHHVEYLAGRAPWEYPASELHTLCENCHADQHGKGKKAMAAAMRAEEEEGDRRRRVKLRETNPAEAAILDRMDAIDAKMPSATNDEKDDLVREKMRLRDEWRELSSRRWNQRR